MWRCISLWCSNRVGQDEPEGAQMGVLTSMISMTSEAAKDMDRFYPGHDAAIEHARLNAVRTVIPEADFPSELFDASLGRKGLVLPSSQEHKNEQLLIGVNAFVAQPSDHASFQQLLGTQGRSDRDRTMCASTTHYQVFFMSM